MQIVQEKTGRCKKFFQKTRSVFGGYLMTDAAIQKALKMGAKKIEEKTGLTPVGTGLTVLGAGMAGPTAYDMASHIASKGWSWNDAKLLAEPMMLGTYAQLLVIMKTGTTPLAEAFDERIKEKAADGKRMAKLEVAVGKALTPVLILARMPLAVAGCVFAAFGNAMIAAPMLGWSVWLYLTGPEVKVDVKAAYEKAKQTGGSLRAKMSAFAQAPFRD